MKWNEQPTSCKSCKTRNTSGVRSDCWTRTSHEKLLSTPLRTATCDVTSNELGRAIPHHKLCLSCVCFSSKFITVDHSTPIHRQVFSGIREAWYWQYIDTSPMSEKKVSDKSAVGGRIRVAERRRLGTQSSCWRQRGKGRSEEGLPATLNTAGVECCG